MGPMKDRATSRRANERVWPAQQKFSSEKDERCKREETETETIKRTEIQANSGFRPDSYMYMNSNNIIMNGNWFLLGLMGRLECQ